MSKKFDLKRICTCVIGVFCVLAVAVFFIAGDAFFYETREESTVDPMYAVGAIYGSHRVNQIVEYSGDYLLEYSVTAAVDHSAAGVLVFDLKDASGAVIAHNEMDYSGLTDGALISVPMSEQLAGYSNQCLNLEISAPDVSAENAISLYYGNSIKVGKGSVNVSLSENEKVKIDGTVLDGCLAMQISHETPIVFGHIYWILFGIALVLLLIYSAVLLRKQRDNKHSPTINFIASLFQYKFLIKQLVSRDFKTKYRRSVLGVFWSFLNPLLTMLVQYLVFSTLFKSAIPHYPVYLLSGIVLYNFFNEATSMGMTSITDNASLITKVYVPKYIYPLTRMLSSAINIVFSLIPLVLVTVFTGILPSASWLLMIYILLCTMGFSLGIMYLLATLMVYFRDINFLWGVISMVWMYCTPIFYPDTIIPESIRGIYHMNPLYQLIHFARVVLIDRVSPSPESYLICFLIAIVPLVIGVLVFNKKQRDFALYL